MVSAPWLDAEEQAAWRAFVAASRLLLDRLDRELQADAGLPHAYYEVLARLSEAPGRTLRMSQLARCSLSSPSRLSHAVARLEELGWVRREACPTDRRGAFAVLTDAGLGVLEAAAPRHVEGIRSHLLEPLSRQQVAQLREIGEAVVRHLQDADALPGAPARAAEA
jgi:DNA-binding MarR family transcriptional regulator